MKLKNKLLIFALLAVLIVSALPFTSIAAESANAVDYYGYEALKALPNSEALLYAYGQVVSGVENCDSRITVVKQGQTLTQDEVELVFETYKRDHAEHFWLGDSYRVSTTYVEPSYLMTKAELPAAKRAFEAAVTEILGDVDEIDGDFEKELYLHDRLIKSVIYDLSEEYMHSAYGALVLGRAVCDGYTESFQYLLRRAGIEAYTVYGKGDTENHAWNIVLIDGNYYHVDATWNDQGIYGFHSYFNITTANIEIDHDIWATEYDLPACNSTAKNYFTVKGGRISSEAECTVALVGDALAAGGGYASFYLDGSMTSNQFCDWISDNFGSIVQRAGFTGEIGGSFIPLGGEIILTAGDIETHPWFVTVTGFRASTTLNVSVGSVGKIATVVTPSGAKLVNFVFVSSDESVATVNAESGLVIGHKKGTARITVKATDDAGQTIATQICTVTVGCEHETKRHVEAGTSTCKVQANAEHYVCELCGQILASNGTTALDAIPKLPFAEHDFEKIISEDNIKTPGNCQSRTVYCESCSVCGEKDENATFEGDFGEHSHGSDWESDQYGHWHECICGDKADAASHSDLDRNGKCDVCLQEVAVQTEEQTTTEVINDTERSPDTEETTVEETLAPEDEESSEPENVTTNKVTDKVTDEPKKETKPQSSPEKSGCGNLNPALIIVTLICAAASFAVVRRKK